MNYELFTEFDEDEDILLRKQNVILEDYDFALITYDLNEFYKKDDDNFIVKNWNIRAILEIHENTSKIYEIVWNGKPAILALSCHS